MFQPEARSASRPRTFHTVASHHRIQGTRHLCCQPNLRALAIASSLADAAPAPFGLEGFCREGDDVVPLLRQNRMLIATHVGVLGDSGRSSSCPDDLHDSGGVLTQLSILHSLRHGMSHTPSLSQAYGFSLTSRTYMRGNQAPLAQRLLGHIYAITTFARTLHSKTAARLRTRRTLVEPTARGRVPSKFVRGHQGLAVAWLVSDRPPPRDDTRRRLTLTTRTTWRVSTAVCSRRLLSAVLACLFRVRERLQGEAAIFAQLDIPYPRQYEVTHAGLITGTRIFSRECRTYAARRSLFGCPPRRPSLEAMHVQE
jgi:hypothetical protein